MSQAFHLGAQHKFIFKKDIPVSFGQNSFDVPCPRYHFFDPKDDGTIPILMLELRMRMAVSHS